MRTLDAGLSIPLRLLQGFLLKVPAKGFPWWLVAGFRTYGLGLSLEVRVRRRVQGLWFKGFCHKDFVGFKV